MEDYTKEAIDWLKTHLSPVTSLVCISGGKDSVVIAELARIAEIPHQLQSTLTGIDPPELIRFIKQHYPQCKFVRPRLSYWHLLTTHNPPGGTGRGIKWCCTKIKESPSWKGPLPNRILGIRKEESLNRAKYGRINPHTKHPICNWHPILEWKEWQIWEFIERQRLPYPKLYDEGFERLGCVICPNHANHHEMYRERWPKYFECFEKYVRIWWNKRVGQGREMYHERVEDFLQDWYSGKYYYYKH